MNNQEIVNQLKGVLPKYTGDFTTNYSITSLTRVGATVTAVTDTDHNLVTTNKVLIKGAKSPITISSLTRVGDKATAITATEHNLVINQSSTEISGADQTEYNGTRTLIWSTPVIDILTIEIAGNTATVTTKSAHGLVNDANIEVEIRNASGNYNGLINLDSVPTSTTFTYTVYGEVNDATHLAGQIMNMSLVLNSRVFMFTVDDSAVTPATGTIAQLSLYINGYNGYQTITSVPTTTSFTYSIAETPGSPAQGTILARALPTVTGFIDIERAKRFYESAVEAGQSNKWVMAIVEDEIVNKNNFNRNDNTSTVQSGNVMRESSYQNLNVYIFLPCGATNDELTYLLTRDAGAAYKSCIYKALLGFTPSSSLSDPSYSRLTPMGNGMQEFNGSYYIHYFAFQAAEWINEADAVDPQDLSAFRTFDFDVIDNEGFEESVMEIAGDVDVS